MLPDQSSCGSMPGLIHVSYQIKRLIHVKWTAVSNCLNTKKKTIESVMKTSKLRNVHCLSIIGYTLLIYYMHSYA